MFSPPLSFMLSWIQRFRHFADWSMNSAEFNTLREVEHGFIETFLDDISNEKWGKCFIITAFSLVFMQHNNFLSTFNLQLYFSTLFYCNLFSEWLKFSLFILVPVAVITSSIQHCRDIWNVHLKFSSIKQCYGLKKLIGQKSTKILFDQQVKQFTSAEFHLSQTYHKRILLQGFQLNNERYLTKEGWLQKWSELLCGSKNLNDFPVWLQVFSKVVFQVMNKSGKHFKIQPNTITNPLMVFRQWNRYKGRIEFFLFISIMSEHS